MWNVAIEIMKLSACLALGLLGVVQAITVNDLYPFNPQHDARLPIGDSAISHKISLAVPAKFYDTEYDYLWVSCYNVYRNVGCAV